MIKSQEWKKVRLLIVLVLEYLQIFDTKLYFVKILKKYGKYPFENIEITSRLSKSQSVHHTDTKEVKPD